MAYFQFNGADEENPELAKLKAEVADDSDNYEAWEKLVRTAESLEGGLNRNSSPQAIQATRDIYDRFLAKFPLFFGYWKKYADMEFAVGGTESAELVYERGVASIINSVDLWSQYCAFKVETSHDPDVIRELFERAADSVGLDFLAHPFWDKYLEYEERLEATDKIFEILSRVIHIPMHQYARYFERYRTMAMQRSLPEQCPADRLAQFKAEVAMEAGPNASSEAETEYALRQKVENYTMEIFQRTQTETTKRWPFEQEIKRPYFHVTELDDAQLSNWRKYLDFEEGEEKGDYKRVTFLYERCLVAAAYYDEFWLRYARWMSPKPKKEQDVRIIYQRASSIYAPIARPTVRLQWALFEETESRTAVAQDIYRAILETLPGHTETIVALANCVRRHEGLDAALNVYKEHVESMQGDASARAALISEWARLLWKIKGAPEEARQVYQNQQQGFLDNRSFWSNYLTFEVEQPGDADSDPSQYARVKQLFEDVRRKTQLPNDAVKDLSQQYIAYLLERGGREVAKEYVVVDREMNGTAKSSHSPQLSVKLK